MTSEINYEDIQTVLLNSPEDKTFNDAKNALIESNNNIIEAIALLWNLEKNKEKEKEKTKIDELREICEEFDEKMQYVIKKVNE